MALPTTISSVGFPQQNYFCGPFIDGNGAVYVIIPDAAASLLALEAHKATDPTSSFTEVDAAGAPVASGISRSAWVFQDGDTLHCARTVGGGATVEYSKFYTSDHATLADTWDNTVVDEVIETVTDTSASAELSISIAARSDGTVVVLYNGDEDKVKGNPFARVDYNIRSTGGTWGGPNEVTSGMDKLEVNYFGSVIVRGASDKCHFFWKDETNGDAKYANLTSGDSLSSTSDVDTAVPTTLHCYGPGVYFDDSGTERIRVPYNDDVSGSKTSIAIVNDGTVGASVTGVSDNPVDQVNQAATHCLAVDGTTVHLLYSHGGVGNEDLYHDQAATPQGASDWGTDTEELDAVTINRISCNVYTRSGTKYLAYVYDDAGTVKYNEKDISGVSASLAYNPFPRVYQHILNR